MIVPTTRLFQAGEQLTGAQLNQTVTSLGNFLLGKPIAQLVQAVAQNIATGTDVACTFTTEEIDRDNGHSNSTNTSRYTAATPGWYRLSGNATFSASSAGTFRQTQFRKNGTTLLNGAHRFRPGSLSAASNISIPAPVTMVYLNGTTDYVELILSQDSGVTLTTVTGTNGYVCMMSVEWMSL